MGKDRYRQSNHYDCLSRKSKQNFEAANFNERITTIITSNCKILNTIYCVANK